MVEARRRPEAAHARSAPSPRLIFFFCVCGTVAVRRRPVAPHARSAPSPWPLSLFLITDGGSAAEVKDLTDARLMAAMPPRPVASLLFTHAYCF
jgi:hypothetical protein